MIYLNLLELKFYFIKQRFMGKISEKSALMVKLKKGFEKIFFFKKTSNMFMYADRRSL